jgi:alpha-1,2-mannosyltransferase
VFFLLIGLGFCVPPIVNAVRKPSANKDYSLWFHVGRSVTADEPLYQPGENGEILYMYPPPLAVFVFAPLTRLGPVGFVAVLAAGNVLAWIAVVVLTTVLVTSRWAGHPRVLYWVPGAAIGPYVWDSFLLGQVNLVLLCLTVAAMLALRHGRGGLAGGLLGLAVVIKVFPLPVLAYFLVRRQWRAVTATVVTIVGLLLLPAVVRGWDRNQCELRQWVGMMVGDQSGSTMAARSSIGFTRRNQSVVSVAHRLLREVDAGDRNGEAFRVNLTDLPPAVVQKLGFVVLVGLAGVFLIVTRCRFARSIEQEGLEVGLVLALVPLASPLAWTYFFSWLLPAWAAGLAYALNHRQRWPWVALSVVGLVLASALSELVDPILQAYGATAAGAVGLYLTLAAMRYASGSNRA